MARDMGMSEDDFADKIVGPAIQAELSLVIKTIGKVNFEKLEMRSNVDPECKAAVQKLVRKSAFGKVKASDWSALAKKYVG